MGNEREISGGEWKQNHFSVHPLFAPLFACPISHIPTPHAHSAEVQLLSHSIFEKEMSKEKTWHTAFLLTANTYPGALSVGAPVESRVVIPTGYLVCHGLLSTTVKSHQNQNHIFEVCILKLKANTSVRHFLKKKLRNYTK